MSGRRERAPGVVGGSIMRDRGCSVLRSQASILLSLEYAETSCERARDFESSSTQTLAHAAREAEAAVRMPLREIKSESSSTHTRAPINSCTYTRELRRIKVEVH